MEPDNKVTRSPRRVRTKIPQPLHALQIADALLKIQTVTAVTGMSASSVRRAVAANTFPAPIKRGTRCTRWQASAVTSWLRKQGGAA